MKAFLAFVLLLIAVVSANAQESLSGTTVTTVGPTINASPTPGSAGSGNVFAITAGGQISIGGVVTTPYQVTANVIELYYINHSAYQENASLNWYGPMTTSSPGAQVSNPVVSTSNLQPDLSKAGAAPVTGLPSSKIAYSLTLYPNNVSAQIPDTTTTTIWNTYFGTFAQSRPVVNLETGCSCDNSNGNLTDDQNFMNNWVAYANGQAAGGYTITGTQQPLSNNWFSWGSFAENPNGTLNANGTIKSGQQAYWSQLLYTPTGPNPVQATTWNPNDSAPGITLTNNNLTATSGASGVFDIRSTNGKSTGKLCWGVVANTNSTDFGVGLSNSSYVLGGAGGLGSDGNGYGFYAGKANPNAQIAFLNGTLLTSGTASPSPNGEELNECHDFDAQLDWVTDVTMRATYGVNAWNNSSTCNPTVASCGISTSGLSCPCFIAYHNRETGVAKLNTNGLFSSGLPPGFSSFDPVVTSTGRPMIVIMGRNGEYHVASIH